MSRAPVDREPTTELAARTAERRQNHERIERRRVELRQMWAETRIRRSTIQAQRRRVRADLQLRRASGPGDHGRAAAALLEAAMTITGVSLSQLWLDYVALGGSATPEELAAILAGDGSLDRGDHDRIALAINERLEDAGYRPLVSYWNGSS